jgi:hypothetical protein
MPEKSLGDKITTDTKSRKSNSRGNIITPHKTTQVEFSGQQYYDRQKSRQE